MDAATVLEEYLSDLTNLPTDLAYILDEMQAKNEKLLECQKRATQRDGAIQKYIKAHGSLADNPKEASYPRIRSDLQESIRLQQDKCNLANTGLYIISRQVKNLNDQIAKLERDGHSLPAVAPPEPSTSAPEPRAAPRRPPEKRVVTRDAGSLPGSRPPKRPRSGSAEPRHGPADGMDEEAHYCLCQQGSFGNMVACDNSNCRFEWFHWECVGLNEAPTGTWFCPACRKK